MSNINPALLRWRKTEIPYAILRNTIIKFDSILNPRTRTEMKLLNNSDLEGTLKGKRCFIIGNGPSLKTQDLSLLENEIVFTCNTIMQMDSFSKLKTNYHFWIDPIFFAGDSYVELMKQVNTNNNHPIVFYPVDMISFVKAHKLDELLNVRYFKTGYTIYEGYNKKFDFCRILPLVTTVVMCEIFLAIYMQASEIYLMGCDNTGAISHIRSIENQNLNDLEYAYEMSDEEKKIRKKAYKADGNEFFFYLQSKGFQHYRIINEYCNKRGIKLVNCTAGGILNEIQRDTLASILGRG